MNYTDNYNLNLPEGTDIVNPLVDTNPNFVSIDTQMKENQDASIGTATEIKTGNVHALTRANGDGAVFRFTATAVFNAGDTFTVDGVAVTALLPSGETLAEGAYIIGSEIICCLKATLLTVFVSSNQAANSARLNNRLPAFYTDSENINFDGSANFITATNVSNALKELRAAKVIFTSSATGTHADKIGEVYAFFNTLPNNIKEICKLVHGTEVFYIMGSRVSGQFGAVNLTTSAAIIDSVNLSASSYRRWTSSTNTITDLSTNVDEYSFFLMLD